MLIGGDFLCNFLLLQKCFNLGEVEKFLLILYSGNWKMFEEGAGEYLGDATLPVNYLEEGALLCIFL